SLRSSIALAMGSVGERVVAFFNPLADTDKGAQVKIEVIKEVLTKEVEDMTAENEEEFGNLE
ncbi:hypothetical protein, partial [Escherichia coli]|uniref:hypothetical protein n=1 Tax=Escherichia coli TaxID=562 RepID=UPI00202F38F4